MMKPGDHVELTYLRNGEEKTASVTLSSQQAEKVASADTAAPEALGLQLAPAAEVAGASKTGVAIVGVDPGGAAAEKGLTTGDVILDVAGKPVTTPQEVRSSIASAKEAGKKAILMRIQTASGDRFVAFPFPKA